jgi:hypothetical protein
MVQRRSDKVNRLEDEQLKHEAEPLVRGAAIARDDWRDQEAPGDDEPLADQSRRPDLDQESGSSLTQRDVQERSEIARFIEPHVFPAHRDDLIDSAHAQGATVSVLSCLDALPGDRQYDNGQDVWMALGHGIEKVRTIKPDR